MKKLVIRDKNILSLVGLSVVVLIVVLGPITTMLKSRIATQKQLKKQLAALELKKEVLNGIDSVQIDERVKKMEKVFPSDKPVVELMSSLSKLAVLHGLSFGGITLNPGELGAENKPAATKTKKAGMNPDLQDLRFGFEVAGGFDKISDFLKALENTAPLMRIEKVSLKIKGEPVLDRLSTSVAATIDVAAYFQSPPKTLGSVSQPIVLLSKQEEKVLERLFNFQIFEAVIPVGPVGQMDLFGQGESL